MVVSSSPHSLLLFNANASSGTKGEEKEDGETEGKFYLISFESFFFFA